MEKALFFCLAAFASLLLLGCVEQPKLQPATEAAGYSALNGTGVLGMAAQKGDIVAVDYAGTLDDGTVFDTSLKEGRTPLEFEVGAGQMIAGFDKAVVGMKVGDEKTVRINASDAYGERDPSRVIDVSKDNAPAGVKVGTKLADSQGRSGVVTAVTNTTVSIDFNHELAGKALNFRIIMRKITRP
jgi:FKBP-type peptidyl-prolyl cis-trans isomerase 2